MITLIVNKGKCKCDMCTMTKYGLDYFCNRCGKPEFDITDDNFMDTPDVDLINDLRAELDEEAKEENKYA